MNLRALATVWIAILTLSVQTTNAQLSKKYKLYEQHIYKGIHYGLFKPSTLEPGKSYPLIVYLHGSRDTVSRDLGCTRMRHKP